MTLACAVHAEAEIKKSLEGSTDLLKVEENFLQMVLSNGEG